jgi:glutaredoxin
MFYMITKDNCLWCDLAKELLQQRKAPFGAFHYNEHPMIVKLMFKAGIKSVPQIWYEGEYIGGYENLVEWLKNNDA